MNKAALLSVPSNKASEPLTDAEIDTIRRTIEFGRQTKRHELAIRYLRFAASCFASIRRRTST